MGGVSITQTVPPDLHLTICQQKFHCPTDFRNDAFDTFNFLFYVLEHPVLMVCRQNVFRTRMTRPYDETTLNFEITSEYLRKTLDACHEVRDNFEVKFCLVFIPS